MAHKLKNNASLKTACCSLEENKQESDINQTDCCTIENVAENHVDHNHHHDDVNENEFFFSLALR